MISAKCYKMFLMSSNIALLFVGLTIFILGIKMKWALSVLLLINIPVILKAVEAVIATGFFISLSGVTGLCGACSENKWLLLGYLISLGIIVVMEFSLGVTLMIVKKTATEALDTPDCNGVCSASIDAAILEYALPSAGLMMSVIFVEALMIYSSIKMYFYIRDNPKVTISGPPVIVQDVQMRNVVGSHSTYVGTPQPTFPPQFEYSPRHFQTYLGRQIAGEREALEDKPPDYNTLPEQPPPLYMEPSSPASEGISESSEPKETDEVFNQV